jgi:hypothetical protein
VVKNITVQEIEEWAQSVVGGIIVQFSPENFKTISYYLREFAVETVNPLDEIGAFRLGNLLVVGKRSFLGSVKQDWDYRGKHAR